MANANSHVPYPWERLLKPLTLSRYFYTISITALAHFVIFRRFYHQRPIWKLFLGIIALLMFFIALRYMIEELIFPATLGYGNYVPTTTPRFYIVDNVYYGSVIIFIGFVLYLFDEMFHQRRQQQKLLAANKSAELNFLEAQMNPHFLFNTINNIYSLALDNNAKTATALLKLSDMMRYVTYRKEKLVPLSEELVYIGSLFEIHQLRQDHALQVKWKIPNEVKKVRLPPLLLVAIVENALKHGDLSDPVFPLIIEVSLVQSSITLQVQNKVGERVSRPGGLGLTNLTRRLALLYEKNKYSFDSSQMNEHYIATLTIPLQT